MQKTSQEQFIKKFISIHGNRYDISLLVYKGLKYPIIIICREHGVYEQRADHSLRGQNCPKCSSLLESNKEEFIIKAKLKHPDKNNNYDEFIYVNSHTKSIIICPIHGKFLQNPMSHLSGNGCPECGNQNNKARQKFKEHATKIHNNKFVYDEFIYVNSHTKSIIICPIHGKFLQNPSDHMNGKGCPECGGTKKKTLEQFIDQASLLHNNKFNYDEFVYVDALTKGIIICPEHERFLQKPNDHLSGYGCPNCTTRVSKPETKWLNYIGILEENRQIKLPNLGRNIVDGYDPKTNTVYEFYGDFWHGNPKTHDPNKINLMNHKTFGYLYTQTMIREEKIKQHYNLLTIWENEWIQYIKENKNGKTL
jgi:hypothetical protein